MRRSALLLCGLLVACDSSRRTSPAVAPPADATPVVVVVTPDAAVELPIVRRAEGYDFREVPLEPDLALGQDQRCVVEGVTPREGFTRVTCGANHASAEVDIVGTIRTAERQVLTLHIDAVGEAPAVARTTLRAVEGKLAELEPPSRCCRDRDEDPDHRPPPPPEPSDFKRVEQDNAWGSYRSCKVQQLGEVFRVEPGGVLDPAIAKFGLEVWCGNGRGMERVFVGDKQARQLLTVARGTRITINLQRMKPRTLTGMWGGTQDDVDERH